MAILKERWFLDVEGQRLVRDLRSNLDASLPPLTQGDVLDMEIHTVEPDGTGGFRYIDADDLTCRAGLFSLADAAPTEGKVRWGYDGEWTSPLDIDADVEDILSALNGLSTVSDDIESVEKNSAGVYTITWKTAGVRELVLADVEDTYPSSYSKSRRKIAGNADTIEVQRVTLRTNAAAGQTQWDPLDAPEAAVEVLSGGSKQVQKIAFDVTPVDGQLILGFGDDTAVVPVSGDAQDLQAALEALDGIGDGNATVTGDWATGFIVVLTGIEEENMQVFVPDSSGLVGPKGKKAQLEIEGPEVDDLLGDQEEVTALFEIEMRENGNPHTLLQLDVTLRNGRWEPESDTRPPTDRILGESVANSRFVRYDEAQALDAGQQAQARENIGLIAMLCREPVAGPVSFDTPGEDGQYWFDPNTSRLWVYVAGQFRYTTFISAE